MSEHLGDRRARDLLNECSTETIGEAEASTHESGEERWERMRIMLGK